MIELPDTIRQARLNQLSATNQIKRHAARIVQIKSVGFIPVNTLLHRFDEIERLKRIVINEGGTIPDIKQAYLT